MDLYTVYFGGKEQGAGFAFCCTNKRVLADKTGLTYSRLVKLFTREKRNYIEIQGYIIIQSKVLIRGGQRIKVNKSDTTFVRNR